MGEMGEIKRAILVLEDGSAYQGYDFGAAVRGNCELVFNQTVEGLRHRELPIFSIQYHSEASPGPRDNVYLFEKFLEMVRG